MSSVERKAIYPGTFDPVTNGHLDIIARAVRLFDEVCVAVTTNLAKQPLFSVDERVEMVNEATKNFKGVVVEPFQGLLMDYARERGATAVVRGLRAITDFEYEFQMALMNRKLADEIDTVFLMPNEKFTYLNSTIVKEVAKLQGDVSAFVSPSVLARLRRKFEVS